MEVSANFLFIIGAVVLALIVAAGLLGYFVYRSMNKGDDSNDGDMEQMTFKLNNDSILLKDSSHLEDVVTSASSEDPVVIFFGHPACHHCAASVSNFEEAATEGTRVYVADGSVVGSSALEKYRIDAFPTILKFTSTDERVEYAGDRSVSSFSSFMK